MSCIAKLGKNGNDELQKYLRLDFGEFFAFRLFNNKNNHSDLIY